MMDEESVKTELEYLRHEIHAHNYRYHVLARPVISDAEYDRLMNRLREIEKAHPEWIMPDSPTQRLTGQVSEGFVKVRHPAPILSLSNAFDVEGVRAWAERIARLDARVWESGFVLEPKIDGLSVVVHYEEGTFHLGATRGDGLTGEDISRNLRTIKTIPMVIPVEPNGQPAPVRIVVRGEAFMNIQEFEMLNQHLAERGEKTYLNPRNTAAGSIRQLDSAVTAQRPLRWLCYQIVDIAGRERPATQWETLEYLRGLGFPVTPVAEFCPNPESMLEACSRWLQRRDQFEYEVDGVVVKLNDLKLAEALGVAGKDPRGAVALKFPAREVSTRLYKIGVNVGRTGVLTPYAMLDAVEIGGVMVKQATLHNYEYIAEKDIREGDRVMVKRAGDVIPYVIGPIPEARDGSELPFQPPEVCPACGQPAEHLAGETAWYCINAACPAQLIRNLEHFASRGAMEINGMGIRVVEQLAESQLVQDVADIYSLTRDQLLQLEGFAEKKAENLLAGIRESKQRSLPRVINALGIRGVGEVMSNDLSRRFRNLDALKSATPSDLQRIEGVGPNISFSILDWFRQTRNRTILEKLKAQGIWPTAGEYQSESSGELDGLSFVVTGTLPDFSREGIKEWIVQHGGSVGESVSRKTSYLVAGENPGSKLEKARALGITVLDQRSLLDLVQ